MSTKAPITPEEHRRQIRAYKEEVSVYKQYAQVLGRIFGKAFPLAVVQAREKKISSFAEKCVRRFEKYPDAVNMLTDLCGARIIVQTLDLVGAVREFIEANFTVLEVDNKSQSHSEDEFGYNDIHYIVQLRPDRQTGVTDAEHEAIGDRKAELQVRTVLQHAWADILHDRIYKTVISVPTEWRREANRLAALLEKADQSFGQLADALDSQTSAYEVFLTREKLVEETEMLKAILAVEENAERRPELALKLGRVLMTANRWDEAVHTLADQRTESHDFAVELGYALCMASGNLAGSEEFKKGWALLESVAAPGQPAAVSDIYSPTIAVPESAPSLRAKALYRMGRIYWLYLNDCPGASQCFLKAHTLKLENPYYHVAYVQAELCRHHDSSLLHLAAVGLRADIDRCRQHVALGIELPNALFTIARCRLLLGETAGCLCAYAKAIEVTVPKNSCMPNDLLDAEIKAVEQLAAINRSLAEQVSTLLHLARWRSRRDCADAAAKESHAWLDRRRQRRAPPFKTPVLLVIGGAGYMPLKKLQAYYDQLLEALDGFQGTVVCGGTTMGIPDVVGNVTRALAHARRSHEGKDYDLIAYLPTQPFADPAVREHESYQVAGRTDSHDFTERELIACWLDLLLDGVDPAKVVALGINGGRVASFEYRLALAFGATVGILRDSGRAAAVLLADSDWKNHPRLIVLPEDKLLVWAFANRHNSPTLSEADIEKAAPVAHEFYRQKRWEKGETSDEGLKPWNQLDPGIGFQSSNKDQVAFVDNVVRKAGFQIKKVAPEQIPVVIRFTTGEIEDMAQREHARWMLERIAKGWVYGKTKHAEKKINPYIIPWEELPNNVKNFDREAVSLFPDLLAQLGYEIRRTGGMES